MTYFEIDTNSIINKVRNVNFLWNLKNKKIKEK
jgi:hypothetical protein